MRAARAPARLTDPRGGYGRAGELIAVACYRLCGYRILGRRVRTAAGEVDIVARRGATLVVIEVKRRRRVDPATVWLGRQQLRRIHRAARLLAGEAPWARRVRVDLVTIVGARVRIARDL